MYVNTLLKVLEQLLRKIKANMRREIIEPIACTGPPFAKEVEQLYCCPASQMQSQGLDQEQKGPPYPMASTMRI